MAFAHTGQHLIFIGKQFFARPFGEYINKNPLLRTLSRPSKKQTWKTCFPREYYFQLRGFENNAQMGLKCLGSTRNQGTKAKLITFLRSPVLTHPNAFMRSTTFLSCPWLSSRVIHFSDLPKRNALRHTRLQHAKVQQFPHLAAAGSDKAVKDLHMPVGQNPKARSPSEHPIQSNHENRF